MERTLREIIIDSSRELQIKSYQDKRIKTMEIRVAVERASVKHGTEMTMFRGENPFERQKYDEEYQLFLTDSGKEMNESISRPGNMWVGRIVETGSRVKGFEIGQRVAGYGPIRYTVTIDSREALLMNETMKWQEAVCYDPAHFAMGGIRDSNVRIGDNVAISGLGAIGLLCVQMARQSGAKIIVGIDPIEKRRRIAKSLGASIAINPGSEDAGLEMKKITDGRGVDAAIEASGSYGALQALIRGLAYGGNIAVVGWYKECKQEFNLGLEAHFNQPNLVFSRACSKPNRDHPRWTFERIEKTCWKMLSEGRFDCERIIDPVISFDDVPKVYPELDRHPEMSVKLGVTIP
jgi:threonine dehydrogenase-like Zn-dependent dehydrogenase